MTKQSTKRALNPSVTVNTSPANEGTESEKLTKAQLIEQLGAQAKLTKAQSTGVVNALLQAVVEALTQGHTVSLPDLGTFSVKTTAARTGRNPSTGEAIQIPARKKVAFKVATTLKSRL